MTFPMPTWLRIVLAVAVLIPLTGCATATHITVTSRQATNDGKTLYMLVRNLDGKQSTTERYQEAAARVFADPPDPSVLATQPIFPGNTVEFTVKDEDLKQLVLYFFFPDPGPNWRVPLPRPAPAEVYVDLGEKQVDRIQVRKR